MSESKGRYLLSIEEIPPQGSDGTAPSKATHHPTMPAYFVGSTAPNNVEQAANPVYDPAPLIQRIAEHLVIADRRELLVAIHGYNMAVGTYSDQEKRGSGVKGWYQDIRDHIVANGFNQPGMVMLGYRWPSERIKGIRDEMYGDDTWGAKVRSAQKALPKALKVLSLVAVVALVLLVVLALVTDKLSHPLWGTLGVVVLTGAVMLLSIVLTLFLLRIAGYFRDRYRANNFGVAELVELFRHLDQAILNATPVEQWRDAGFDNAVDYWQTNRIKLSFIGHSMGSFVVTDTVRILSDVFDKRSIGSLKLDDPAKHPTGEIGDVFSLARLVLVSPDIPVEAIISSRANFLRSSLRRFEEAYLFTNEGDMALKLASTAANYASFPARTSERGYRLGNVVVRIPDHELSQHSSRYGIVNLSDLEVESGSAWQRFLKYLYILQEKGLISEEASVNRLTGPAAPVAKAPIATSFTVFDCTDYREFLGDRSVGLLTQALGRRSLRFHNYLALTYAYFRGKIDTHGGYFAAAQVDGVGAEAQKRPEAHLTKHLIYGLACLGFDGFLSSPLLDQLPRHTAAPIDSAHPALEKLSQLCRDRQIQVLLSPQRYPQSTSGSQQTPAEQIGFQA